MNKRKILLLFICFVLVVGIAIQSTNAKTYTKSVKFKNSPNFPVNKYIGKENYISTFYDSKFSIQHNKKRTMIVTIVNVHYFEAPTHYKLISAKIKFTKKVKGKTKTTSKTYKPNKNGSINRQSPKGWKPISAVVKYKNKS
ncbi:MAG: hypothetical protein FWH54_00200 [Methanobrevibacter sp.]|nr:hypothetical protein [Methanobrevibacter sp.]